MITAGEVFELDLKYSASSLILLFCMKNFSVFPIILNKY
jgi:hypothetical protein